MKNTSLDDEQNFTINLRDGADGKKPILGVDNVGGLTGGFSKNIANGATEVYDLRGTNNPNGRGFILVSASIPDAGYLIGFSDGNAVHQISFGSAVTETKDTVGKLNIFMVSPGRLGIQNNYGSERIVSVTLLAASR
ncbi:hypothetical protein FZC78_19115 [Rossellomorea vietnamensis]|uniref:Uncharacterized protein n=1 Tax=Rossellomorea vietnamensis TaxID=218284 RepID=A0A5D4NL97_9BACI|nr:hypothetical protein [Rossellomorea vietnamensis]TYS14268.1 hypothetical protein FZC78_19115 [Rossellomorea vietnamensis]